VYEKPCAPRSFAAQPMVGLVVLATGIGLAYYAWPSEIADAPLASLTLGMIDQAVYAVCLALLALLIANTLRD
jgi:hypothetical protein